MSSPFGAVLRSYREATPGHVQPNRYGPLRRVLSQTELAVRAGVDSAYINRLESGKQQSVPTRATVLRFAVGLALGPLDTDRLLVSAGYCPTSIAALDPDRLDAVLRLLAVDQPGAERRWAG